jgi:hypothetical protein
MTIHPDQLALLAFFASLAFIGVLVLVFWREQWN